MSDARFREIGRAAAAGDLNAAAQLLTERLRNGSLILERLQLAAVCGDAASLLACGERLDGLCDCGQDVGNEPGHRAHRAGQDLGFEDWIRALQHWRGLISINESEIHARITAAGGVDTSSEARAALKNDLIALALRG